RRVGGPGDVPEPDGPAGRHHLLDVPHRPRARGHRRDGRVRAALERPRGAPCRPRRDGPPPAPLREDPGMTTETSTTDPTPDASTGAANGTVNGAVPVISLAEVSKWYGNVVAVNDVSFDIGPGITGLLGPNGAGKSTLLHMMGGLLRASSGVVSILGEPAAGNPEVYRRVGIVLEREAVYGGLSGWDFVRMNAKLHGLSDADAATRRAIERVDMGYAQDRLTGGYSKGMKQRIKIAAAIVHDPRVLILDEPFNGADPRQRIHMIDMLRSMAREGRTIVFS